MFGINCPIRKYTRLTSIGLLFPAACAFIAAGGPAPAYATGTTLYSFTNTSGAQPQASLTADAKGNLYGTTHAGGAFGFGAVFRLTRPASANGGWTETVLYSFTGGADGKFPAGNVIFGSQGSLYGAASLGGSDVSGNAGVVFELTPPASGKGAWQETVLHNFLPSQSDGYQPQAGLIERDGAFYGTTQYGGASNMGTVFKLTPPASAKGSWTETILYSFQGHGDGTMPMGNLVFDTKGALYGTTSGGGSSVTGEGFGTVFKLTPAKTGPWEETVLYRFKGQNGSDGANPQSALIFDRHGALYGTAWTGGSGGNSGVVFKVSPPVAPSVNWTEEVLLDFTGSGMFNPAGSLIFDAEGKLYGVTSNGGSTQFIGYGAAYSLTPPASGPAGWTLAVLYNFPGGNSGGNPLAGLISPVNGTFYGTTSVGGSGGFGAVFELQGLASTSTSTSTSTASGTVSVAAAPAAQTSQAPCKFNGATIPDSKTFTAYASLFVPYGQTCASQPRTCTNGTLSGTYTHATCHPQPAAYSDPRILTDLGYAMEYSTPTPKLNFNGKTVVLWGDSITEGLSNYYRNYQTQFNEAFPGATVYNFGVSGDMAACWNSPRSQDMTHPIGALTCGNPPLPIYANDVFVDRSFAKLVELKPDYIFIRIGINDLITVAYQAYNGGPANNMAAFLDAIKAQLPNTKVFVHSPTPIIYPTLKQVELNLEAKLNLAPNTLAAPEWSTWQNLVWNYKGIAEFRHYYFVCDAFLFTNSNGLFPAPLYKNMYITFNPDNALPGPGYPPADGLHPNSIGYRFLRQGLGTLLGTFVDQTLSTANKGPTVPAGL
jgi:uncharacterized repeat protein (TIGR03803 family)